MKPTIVVLAAGLGTRMRSGLTKALHPLAGRPLVRQVLNTVRAIDPGRIVVVLGHQADRVREACEGFGAEFVLQREQLGTGHAVRQASDAIADADGPVVVLCADTPLLTPETLQDLLAAHIKARAAVTLLTATVAEPYGYGRVLRGRSGVTAVVEEKDATRTQKKVKEVNSGIYCFEKKFLLSVLGMIGKENAQGEYYLPDTISIARKKRLKVAAMLCGNAAEIMGVNTREDLSRAEQIIRERTNRKWMLAGVTMLDPGSVFVEGDVLLGRDVILYPNVILEGATTIGEGTTVYTGCRITDSVIGKSVLVKDHSVLLESVVADGASIGPFAHLRPGTVVGERARIGNFVEVKKSVVGEGSKANHLSYIGDATVGKNVNIGAGVITCNYDGYEKHRTLIEDDVFVGSDAQLVAPVTIGRGALIAAGATITKNVPPDALGISRVKQENREGFAAARRKMKEKKDK